MALVWAESATAATQDFTFYSTTVGTVTSDGTTTKYGGRSIKVAGNSSVLAPTGSLPGLVGCLTFWFQYDVAPAGGLFLAGLNTAINSSTLRVGLGTDQKLFIQDGTGSSQKVAASAIAVNTWYRLCVLWNIVSTTSWAARIYLSTADNTTGSNIVIAGDGDWTLGTAAAPTMLKLLSDTGTNIFIAPIVVDDSSTVSDMGDVRVTAKLPNATGNANNYSTAIGSATNRWEYVNERALSTSKGWKEIGTSAVEESYGIQNAATGDVDLTGKTVVGRMAWLYGKRDTYAATTSASVQFATKQTTTVLPSINVTSGNYLIVGFADQIAGTAPTCAKSAGTSTIGTVTALSGPSTSTVRLSKWYIQVTGTGTLTLTFTHDNSSGKRAGVVAEFPSISASPLDINATNTTDGTSQYDGPASGTLAQANELVVGLFAFAGPGDDTIAVVGSTDSVIVNNGTTGGGATSNSTLYMIARAVEATTTVTQSMTNTTANRAGVQGLVSLKMSAGGGAGSPKLINNGSDVAIVLTSSNQLFTSITTSATYPATSGIIGMKSTANLNDTYLYECGMLIIYAPSTFIVANPTFKLQAVNRASSY